MPELVPVRHQRMAESPFSFFRGAAAVFAADLGATPNSGLTVQLCGDAHLSNFGTFASPERTQVFDMNDFDETLPGPFEWDLKRLAASLEIACRANGFDAAERLSVQQATVSTYCAAMREFAPMGYLDIWYAHLGRDEITTIWGAELSTNLKERIRGAAVKAQHKDRLRAFQKLITMDSGEPRFVSNPPLLEPAAEVFGIADHATLVDGIRGSFRQYRHSLPSERRLLLERYELVDLARKVVGVGSVGTRCWVALLMGKDGQDPLFLQIKEAEPSVLEPHLHHSAFAQHGQRVVEGQRLIQAASDIFLGWQRIPGIDGRTHDYYFRQLWDWKSSADVDTMPPALLAVYGKVCGYTMARAHARSGDAVALSAYLGNGASMSTSIARFAGTYADQNERDHAAFVEWLSTTHEPPPRPASPAG